MELQTVNISRPNQTLETKAKDLSKEEKEKVAELKLRDQKVRAHEQAHLANLGQHSRGGANFQFVTGPDGKRYATSGEVSLDISKEAKPEDTLAKARTIKRAALAPADPSPTDRQVAARAAQMESEALSEITQHEEVAPDEPQTSEAQEKPESSLQEPKTPTSVNGDSANPKIAKAVAAYQYSSSAHNLSESQLPRPSLGLA